MQPIRKILDFFILKCYDNKIKDILYAWKRTFCFHKCYDREQTSWAESVCGKAKQNYHLGAAAERLRQTKGMPVRFRYQPARRTKCYFVEFGWNHENRYSSLVKGRDFYFYR